MRILEIWVEDFIQRVHESLLDDGVVIIKSFLSPDEVWKYRTAVHRAHTQIRKTIGEERLERAGEVGVVRAPMKFEPVLNDLLADSKLRKFATLCLGDGAICHLMNGLVLPPKSDKILEVFQGRFHQDFPRFLNGYLASVNTFVCLDDFTEENGATRFVSGSHQRSEAPSVESINRADTAIAPSGSLVVFDSTIWHAAGHNVTENERVGLNVQWTRAFVKQQIDLVKYLGTDICETFSKDVQASIGMNSRVITSLDEYYVPHDQRLYKPNQG